MVEQQCIYLDCDDKDKVSYQLFKKNHEGDIIASVRILPKEYLTMSLLSEGGSKKRL